MGSKEKQNKIYLSNDQNLENLNLQLEKYQKARELTLSLKYFLNVIDETQKLKEYFEKNQELESLFVTIGKSVFQMNDFLFRLFSSFQSLQNIKKMQLKIDQPSMQVKDIGMLLSIGLKNLYSLQELTLIVTFSQKNDSLDDHGYSLREMYKNLQNLQSLEIQMNQAFQSSLSCFSDGITYLKSLKRFALHFKQCQLTSQNGMGYLVNQLKQLNHLEALQVNIDRFNKMPKYILVELFKCISSLTNLKTLKLHLQFIEIMKLNKLGIANAIQSLTNLEHLTYKIQFGQNLDDIIEQVSSFQNLKNLKVLKFLASVYCSEKSSSQEQQFQELVDKLSSIQAIDSIKINFRSNFSVSQNIFEILFKGLSNQQSLRSLKLNVDHLAPFQIIDVQTISQFQQVIQKLQKFNLSIKFVEEISKDQLTLKFWSEVLQSNNQMKQFILNVNSKSKIKLQSFGNILKNLSQLKICSIMFQESQTWDEFDALLAAKSIQNMHNLEYLTLFIPTLNLFDATSQSLIQSIDKLSSLQSLDLKLKIFSEQGFQNLKTVFHNKTNLKRLNVCFEDYLSQEQLICIFESIKYLTNLKFLKLLLKSEQKIQNNQILFDSMAAGLSNKISLKFLDINFESQNSNAQQMDQLFLKISGLKNLYELCLQFHDAHFTQQDMISVRQQLKNLHKLIYLKFEINSYVSIFTINLLKDLPFLNSIQFVHDIKNFHFSRAISAKKQIEKPNDTNIYDQNNIAQNDDLYKNTIVQVKCYLEKSQLLSLEQLKYLDFCFSTLDILSDVVIRLVSTNSMGQQGAQCLFKSVSKLRCLSSLLIFVEKNNKIGTESVLQLGQSIRDLQNLKSLKLYFNSQGNEIEWSQACQIVECFPYLKEIKLLEYEIFECSNYTNQGIKLFFDSIVNLKQIEQLTLKLGFSLKLEDLNQQISENLVKLQSLKYLDIGFESVEQQTPNQLKILCRILRKLQNLIIITLIENYSNKISIPNNIYKQLKLVTIKRSFFGLEYIKLY